MSEARASVASLLSAPKPKAAYSLSLRERILAALTTLVDGEYGLPTPEDEREVPVTIVSDGADTATPDYDAVTCVMP